MDGAVAAAVCIVVTRRTSRIAVTAAAASSTVITIHSGSVECSVYRSTRYPTISPPLVTHEDVVN